MHGATATLTVPSALPWAHLDIPNRMLAVMRRVRLIGGEDRVTLEDFKREPETCDLGEEELQANIGRASILLVSNAPEPNYDRGARVALGANLVLGLMPQVGTMHETLRNAGFGTREVGQLWDEIVAKSADDFHSNRAPSSKPVDLPNWGREMLAAKAD